MLRKGIEGARHTTWYDTEGKELLEMPPVFVDMEAGFGGPGQTLHARRRSSSASAPPACTWRTRTRPTAPAVTSSMSARRSATRCWCPRQAWLAKLKAIKAASDAAGHPLVIIARTDSIDGAIPGQPQGGVKMAIEDAWEAAELGCDVIWAEFNNTELDQPREFAEGVRKYYPNQMLGFNLSPSLYWGKAKKAGTLITNQQLADLGYTLQFSTLFNFRTVGLALEKGLRKFKDSGLDALADLQIEEDEARAGRQSPRCTRSSPG